MGSTSVFVFLRPPAFYRHSAVFRLRHGNDWAYDMGGNIARLIFFHAKRDPLARLGIDYQPMSDIEPRCHLRSLRLSYVRAYRSQVDPVSLGLSMSALLVNNDSAHGS
jgi:hypothetical protein